MSKQNFIVSIILALVAVLLGFGVSYLLTVEPSTQESVTDVAANARDFKNAEYRVQGIPVTLVDGTAVVPSAPGSASTVTTQYFGNELTLDLNADGLEDTVFLITQNDGGSGTFYYVVAALKTPTGYKGSEAYFLGDRIAPQTTAVSGNPEHEGVVVVNYADRALGEPMTAEPSVGTSVYLKLDPVSLNWGVVDADFSGEADPLFMTLPMKTWVWQETSLPDGTTMTPAKPEAFSITFADDGSFTATTDCNGVGGTYTAEGSLLTFGEMMSTLMYCDGSQESDFVGYLTNTSGYHFTTRGELILDLKFDSGSVVFK